MLSAVANGTKHVIPRSWGGASTADNVQLLCRDCNLKEGASLIDGGCS